MDACGCLNSSDIYRHPAIAFPTGSHNVHFGAGGAAGGVRGGAGDGRGADGILRAGGGGAGGAGGAGQDIPVMEIQWKYNGDIGEIDFNRVQVQSRFI